MVNSNRSQFIAEAVLYNDTDDAVGRDNGIFVRSRQKLMDAKGYGAIECAG